MSERTNQDGPLLRQLRWVHDTIRRDLAVAAELSERVADGEDAAAIRSGIADLRTNGPLWQLRHNCLHYCEFVHSHHGREDSGLFPALRKHDGRLNPVIDRLEADHRIVSDLLDDVEESANGRLEDDGAVRDRLAAALARLARHLLEHLEYEEDALGPTLNGMESWPTP
jgi:iron-sulfur cluster repair protein YtfE (RIC family)